MKLKAFNISILWRIKGTGLVDQYNNMDYAYLDIHGSVKLPLPKKTKK